MEQKYAKVGDTYVYEKVELPTVRSVAVIEDAALMELPEYSCTNPTGVFDNKLWRRAWHARTRGGRRSEIDHWLVCEYVQHPTEPGMCQTLVRRAASPEMVALAADGVFWWLGT